MCEQSSKADVISGCRIYTQYPEEEFTFIWNVTNFSKIFNKVFAQFSTASKATVWQLKLLRGRIELWKHFDLEPINIYYKCKLVTCRETISNEGSKTFGRIFDYCCIMEFPGNVCFENDIFHFQCTLTILGHSITSTTEPTSIGPLNSSQLKSDLTDLLRRQEHCDLKISVGDYEIQVHKAILCARSPVFDKMFQYSLLENDSKQITVSDIDFDVLQDFISFLYSGEVKDLCWDRALQLYYAADKYEVQDLRAACSQFLECHLTTDNVCSVLKLSDLHRDEKLKKTAKLFSQMHSKALMLTEDWQEMVNAYPKLAVEVLK